MAVLYVDYGNLDVVSVDDLCHLPDDLRLSRLSPQALNCRLSDVRAADEVWSDEANTYFEDTVLGKTLLAEIVKMNITDENSTDDDKSMSIRLLDMGILIATKLKEAGYAWMIPSTSVWRKMTLTMSKMLLLDLRQK